MATHPEYPRTRLYSEQPLMGGASISLDEKRSHYLANVLRQKTGDKIAIFNGIDGEWLAEISSLSKKSVTLSVQKQLRAQKTSSDLWLVCAPLKSGKSEWVLEKATELGISAFVPVKTNFTIVDKTNAERLTVIAIEASEQCERLDVPIIKPIITLEKLLGSWPKDRLLIYGDESGASKSAKELLPEIPHTSYAVLIGPEGGFSTTELALLRELPYAVGMCLGPRVLRADTAAIAALTLMQAWLGDWNEKPAFRAAE